MDSDAGGEQSTTLYSKGGNGTPGIELQPARKPSVKLSDDIMGELVDTGSQSARIAQARIHRKKNPYMRPTLGGGMARQSFFGVLTPEAASEAIDFSRRRSQAVSAMDIASIRMAFQKEEDQDNEEKEGEDTQPEPSAPEATDAVPDVPATSFGPSPAEAPPDQPVADRRRRRRRRGPARMPVQVQSDPTSEKMRSFFSAAVKTARMIVTPDKVYKEQRRKIRNLNKLSQRNISVLQRRCAVLRDQVTELEERRLKMVEWSHQEWDLKRKLRVLLSPGDMSSSRDLKDLFWKRTGAMEMAPFEILHILSSDPKGITLKVRSKNIGPRRRPRFAVRFVLLNGTQEGEEEEGENEDISVTDGIDLRVKRFFVSESEEGTEPEHVCPSLLPTNVNVLPVLAKFTATLTDLDWFQHSCCDGYLFPSTTSTTTTTTPPLLIGITFYPVRYDMTLREFVTAQKSEIGSVGPYLDSSLFLTLVQDMASALRSIHKCRVRHNSISLDSIFLSEEDDLVLGSLEDVSVMDRLSKKDARELARRGEPDPDVYSLGVVLYQMLGPVETIASNPPTTTTTRTRRREEEEEEGEGEEEEEEEEEVNVENYYHHGPFDGNEGEYVPLSEEYDEGIRDLVDRMLHRRISAEKLYELVRELIVRDDMLAEAEESRKKSEARLERERRRQARE